MIRLFRFPTSIRTYATTSVSSLFDRGFIKEVFPSDSRYAQYNAPFYPDLLILDFFAGQELNSSPPKPINAFTPALTRPPTVCTLATSQSSSDCFIFNALVIGRLLYSEEPLDVSAIRAANPPKGMPSNKTN